MHREQVQVVRRHGKFYTCLWEISTSNHVDCEWVSSWAESNRSWENCCDSSIWEQLLCTIQSHRLYVRRVRRNNNTIGSPDFEVCVTTYPSSLSRTLSWWRWFFWLHIMAVLICAILRLWYLCLGLASAVVVESSSRILETHKKADFNEVISEVDWLEACGFMCKQTGVDTWNAWYRGTWFFVNKRRKVVCHRRWLMCWYQSHRVL